MPPKIEMPEFKMPELKLPNTSVGLNLNNTYGVGGQKSNGMNFSTSGTSNNTSGVSTNTPVDMNNPAVLALAVSTASAGLHGPLYNSRIQTGVLNMVDAHNRGLRFNSLFLTISNPTDNALNYSNGQFWDTNNSAMGPRSLAHSGYLLNIGTGQYNFGDDRIGRKLLGARRSDGTIDTTKLGRRSMRRLRNVMSSQFQLPALDMQQGNLLIEQQSNPTTPVNLSLKFPNLFPQGFSFNLFGIQPPFQFNLNPALDILLQSAPVLPAVENPVLNTSVRTNPYAQNAIKAGYKDKNSIINLLRLLLAMGYDLGPTGADGAWGKYTDAAYNDLIRKRNATILGTLLEQSTDTSADSSADSSTSTHAPVLLPWNWGNKLANFGIGIVNSLANTWANGMLKNGGVLKAQQGAQIPAKNSNTPALDTIMNNPLLAEQFLAALSQQLGKEITLEDLTTAAANPETGAQLEQLAQQMMKLSAKQGAKLEYVSRLRGKCPEGQELVYFAKGGKVCSACMGKKLENGGEPGYMKSFRDRLKKKLMEKCGGKMKKGK